MYSTGIYIKDNNEDLLFEEMSVDKRTKWVDEKDLSRESLLMVINRLCEVIQEYKKDYEQEIKLIKEKAENEK